MQLFILQWQQINVSNYKCYYYARSGDFNINNFWFWIEMPGAGKQYFFLENCRDQITLGSIYASLVHNFWITLILMVIN